jgi:hypothetical protein
MSEGVHRLCQVGLAGLARLLLLHRPCQAVLACLLLLQGLYPICEVTIDRPEIYVWQTMIMDI